MLGLLSTPIFAQTLYVSDFTGNLSTVDPSTGATTPVGASGINAVSSLAYHPSLDTLFAGTGGQSNNPACLFSVDTTTGASVLVGCLGGAFRSINDLAVSPGGTLFATAYDGSNTELLQLDPNTGTGTSIGVVPVTNTVNDFAVGMSFDPTGTLWYSGSGNCAMEPPAAGFLHTLSTIDATLSPVVATLDFSSFPPLASNGYQARRLSHSPFGVLYSVVFECLNRSEHYLATIDPNSGVVTNQAPLVVTGTFYTGIAWVGQVPENIPTVGNLGLALLAGLLLLIGLTLMRRRAATA